MYPSVVKATPYYSSYTVCTCIRVKYSETNSRSGTYIQHVHILHNNRSNIARNREVKHVIENLWFALLSALKELEKYLRAF